MEDEIQSRLEVAKGGLVSGLVGGTGDYSEDNLIRGRILGLEMAKHLIHEYFLELSNASDPDEAD